jgi:hypothetical protein
MQSRSRVESGNHHCLSVAGVRRKSGIESKASALVRAADGPIIQEETIVKRKDSFQVASRVSVTKNCSSTTNRKESRE